MNFLKVHIPPLRKYHKLIYKGGFISGLYDRLFQFILKITEDFLWVFDHIIWQKTGGFVDSNAIYYTINLK